MNDNLDIFILSYKPFISKVNSNTYKILNCSSDKIESDLSVYYHNDGDNIASLNGFYSELTGIYWLWKNYDIKDYIGVCHYRRYWEFYDEIPNIDELLKEHDIILPKPHKFASSIQKQYSSCHNIDDLNLVGEIINDLYPEYSSAYNNCLKAKYFFACNLFIMKKDDFNRYCEFVFGVLNEFLIRKGFTSMKDIFSYVEDNKSLYLKKSYPCNEVWYQSRIGGFLAERLLNIFVMKNFERVKSIGIVITENKYGKK